MHTYIHTLTAGDLFCELQIILYAIDLNESSVGLNIHNVGKLGSNMNNTNDYSDINKVVLGTLVLPFSDIEASCSSSRSNLSHLAPPLASTLNLKFESIVVRINS